MHYFIVIYIGLRYLRKQIVSCFVFWAAVISIMLGVMTLITVLSVMNGFENKFKKDIIELIPQVIITTTNKILNPQEIPMSTLNNLKGITKITSLVTSELLLQSVDGIAIGIMLGINPKDPEPLSSYLINTNIEKLIAGKYLVILGNKLANQLNVNLGDKIRLTVPYISNITPIGPIPSQRLFTVAGIYFTNNEVDSYQILTNQQDASALMKYPAGYITGWRLWLKKPLEVNNLSKQYLPNNLLWKDWRESKGTLFHAMCIEKNMIRLLLGLIIILLIFSIASSLAFIVRKKYEDIAILQTQGLTSEKIMLVFIIYGINISILGIILGICFGVLLSINLNQLISIFNMLHGVILPINIELIQIIFIVILVILVALLATFYPARHASTISPAKVLNYE